MRVWVVTSGEPLPSDAGNPRLLRAGLLTRFLHDAGHEVVWWTAAFDHKAKRHRSVGGAPYVRLLKSRGYKRNVSFSRLWDHVQLGLAFRNEARHELVPDVIIASLPPLELCAAAVAYGRSHGTAVVVDVRDLWPQAFADMLPRALQCVAGFLLAPYLCLARYCCRAAGAVTGPSREYVAWALQMAGRSATEFDRPFPFAYPSLVGRPILDAAALQAAERAGKQRVDQLLQNRAPARPGTSTGAARKSACSTEPDRIAEAECWWDSLGIGPERDELRICFFGSFGSQFDFDTVLAAARRLQDAKQQVRFILCGAGETQAYWKHRAAGCKTIIFPGWVDAASIWVLMRRCHLGLAPYRDTANFRLNIPNKAIEYLSAGLPVIAGIGGALREMLESRSCGIFYSSGDAGSLASVIGAIAATPQRWRQLADNARQAFDREYSAERVYPTMIKYLAELAVHRTPSAPPDYSSITELPGNRATSDQRQILFSRYDFARQFCHQADVLEIACGSGIGLGYLARRARSVAGVDIQASNCAIAAETYASNSKIEVRRRDAHHLGFPDRSFDVVILLEALYYLEDATALLEEARRVLRAHGTLLVSTANCAWAGFNSSPFSKRYYSAVELRAALQSCGFQARILAAFPERADGARSEITCTLRRVAVRWGAIPRTMHGKEWLKRIFYGPLKPLPRELPENYSKAQPLLELTEPDTAPEFRILYAIGQRR